MQTIYRCTKCGQEYTNKEQAEKHDCPNKYEVKCCKLWVDDDDVSFYTSKRFSQSKPKPDETIYASRSSDNLGSYLRCDVETTDMSEEKEKFLHKALIKFAIEQREEQYIKPLRKELKKLEQEGIEDSEEQYFKPLCEALKKLKGASEEDKQSLLEFIDRVVEDMEKGSNKMEIHKQKED